MSDEWDEDAALAKASPGGRYASPAVAPVTAGEDRVAAVDLTGLADPGLDVLTAHLVAMAQRCRKLAADGDVVHIHDELARVRAAATDATGNRRAILNVAEAFLRALAKADMGRSEIALRRFFADHHEVAEELFGRLLKPSTVGEDELKSVTDAAQAQIASLIELGVLRRVGTVFDLRTSLRSLARDLLEPPALRMWRRVQEARAAIFDYHLDPADASAYLASQLGITQAQASQCLASSPVAAPDVAIAVPVDVDALTSRVQELEAENAAMRREHREEELSDRERGQTGCGDHGCLIAKPAGMGTNGGCSCGRAALQIALQLVKRAAARGEPVRP